MQGIPILAFDPQGDIASLMLPGDPKQLREKGEDGNHGLSMSQGDRRSLSG